MNIFRKFVAGLLAASVVVSGGLTLKAPDVQASEKLNNIVAPLQAPEGIDVGKVNAFVTRLFNVCLDRAPDAAGLAAWSNTLINGEATGICVAYGFIFSDEFQNKNMTNREYVAYMYNAFLGRGADAAGLDAWTDAMDKGASRQQIFKGFAESPEFSILCNSYGILRGDYYVGVNMSQTSMVNLFVNRLYTNILGRGCDPSGLTAWSQALISHQANGAQVAYGLMYSPEFVNRDLCNTCYVRVLYKAFLGRGGSDAEVKAWVDSMGWNWDTCTTYYRENIFNGFVGSQEFTNICSTYGIDRGTANYTGETWYIADTFCSSCGGYNVGAFYSCNFDVTDNLCETMRIDRSRIKGSVYYPVTLQFNRRGESDFLITVDGNIPDLIHDSFYDFINLNMEVLLECFNERNAYRFEPIVLTPYNRDEVHVILLNFIYNYVYTSIDTMYYPGNCYIPGTYIISGNEVTLSMYKDDKTVECKGTFSKGELLMDRPDSTKKDLFKLYQLYG